MSAVLAARDAITSALDWEAAAHGWRLMTLESIAALRAAKLREASLLDQLDALRCELRLARGCAIEDSLPDDDLLL